MASRIKKKKKNDLNFITTTTMQPTTTTTNSIEITATDNRNEFIRRFTSLQSSRPSQRKTNGPSSSQKIKEVEGDSFYTVLVDTVAGICGGMAGKFVEYPADTIKVKLQAQTTTGTTFKGPLDCFKKTVRSSGVRGLYTGLPVPLLGSMAEMGVLFTAMGRIKRIASEDPDNPTIAETCLSGAGAGVCASFVLTPVELIKCRLQTRIYSGGVMECVRSSLKEEGISVFCALFLSSFYFASHFILFYFYFYFYFYCFLYFGLFPDTTRDFHFLVSLSFFLFLVFFSSLSCCHSHFLNHQLFVTTNTDKGYVGTLLREVPGTAAWFGMYEIALSKMCPKDQDPKSWQVVIAGGAGGMGYWGAFYPADTVKTEMQTIGATLHGKSPSFMETFANIYRVRGISGLYAGLGPTLARAIPANAAVFLVYDVVSRAMLDVKTGDCVIGETGKWGTSRGGESSMQ